MTEKHTPAGGQLWMTVGLGSAFAAGHLVMDSVVRLHRAARPAQLMLGMAPFAVAGWMLSQMAPRAEIAAPDAVRPAKRRRGAGATDAEVIVKPAPRRAALGFRAAERVAPAGEVTSDGAEKAEPTAEKTSSAAGKTEPAAEAASDATEPTESAVEKASASEKAESAAEATSGAAEKAESPVEAASDATESAESMGEADAAGKAESSAETNADAAARAPGSGGEGEARVVAEAAPARVVEAPVDSAAVESAPAGTVAVAAERPTALAAPRGDADDLKRIKGVGPKLEAYLHGLGYYHFDQIAAWGAKELAWVDANLGGFSGRATRNDWIGQAKRLARAA